MSYLVLARKYRPQTFEEVVGQKPVVKTLQNSIKRDRVAHAILFSGVRGTGKTTLARLMAKALNCETGPTAVPCNSCVSCTQIISGSSLDLHEIDGASNRGIQEVRELKDKIKFLPASSRYKIIIIDEVHMLTTEAFNALLKTLEEPPAHVYFVFATTELHKIPITILSRCQRYELQRVNTEELGNHFSRIAGAEKIELEKGALSLIVREAEGSVRDGLSLLDQVLSYGDSVISADDVVEVLGLVDREVLLAITRALLSGDRKEALENLSNTFRFGMDIKRFLADLLECFRTLLLLNIEGCDKILDLPEDEIASFQTIASQHPVETIHHKLNLLMRAAENIRYSFQPRLTLETSFLSIIESENVFGVTTLLEKLDDAIANLPDQAAVENDDTDASQPPSPLPAETEEEKKENPAHATPERPEKKTGDPDPDRQQSQPEPTPLVTEEDSPVLSSLDPPPDDTPPPEYEHFEPTEPAHSDQREIRKDWPEFIAYVKNRREWMAQNLQQASAVKEQGQDLILEFDDQAECTLLRSKENRRTLTEYVLDFFQKSYTIHVVNPDESDDRGVKDSEGPKKRRQQLAANPLVRMTEEIFNGHVGDIRIGPLSR